MIASKMNSIEPGSMGLLRRPGAGGRSENYDQIAPWRRPAKTYTKAHAWKQSGKKLKSRKLRVKNYYRKPTGRKKALADEVHEEQEQERRKHGDDADNLRVQIEERKER